MSYFKHYNSSFLENKFEYLFLALIPIFIICFIPINHEPGGECFNEWATARLFLDWDGFPKSSLSLGYVLYSSLLMTFFDYNTFVVIEYLLTFTFFYFCIYFLLRYWLNNFLSFLTIIPFILMFYQIEGHNYVIAIAFTCLYLRQLLTGSFSLFLPLNLILACTFNQTYIFTLIGHYLGVLINIVVSKKKNIFSKRPISQKKNYAYISLKSLAVLVLIITYSLSALKPSPRKDNNHFMDEMPWAPMKITSSLDAGIMQMVPMDYNARRISLEQAKNQDWYFTNQTVFKNAKNALDAIIKVPDVFIETIAFNLRYIITMPNSMILKWHNKPIIILSAIIAFFTFLIFSVNLFMKKKYIFLSSCIIGIMGITFALLLTRTTNLRYNVVYFPFLITFLFQGLQIININFLKKYSKIVLTHMFALIMFFGSLIQNFSNIDKFVYFNWSSIFSNQNGYYYNFARLQDLVRPNDIVLSQDSNWIKAFFQIKHDRIRSLHSLPPFKDDDKLNDLKKTITHFWVKPDIMEVITKRQSTNYYIRYQNYLIPMINFAKKENWEMIQIKNFGVIYRKRRL